MARVVVIGGGFGGLATALRLAKLGHAVTLVEEGPLGGALVPVTADGFAWDTVGHTLLPAVVRDLFRKTGRPLEKEVDLVPLDCVREHWFDDGTALVLQTGRAAQLRAFEGARSRARAARGSTTSRRTPTTGRCCAAATSRCPGSPTTYLARSPPGWTRASRCTGGSGGRCATRARGWSRRTRSPSTATTSATCPPGPASPRTSSSASAPGRRPAGPAYSWRRWYAGSAPAASTSYRPRATDVVVRAGRAVAVSTSEGDLDADVVVCAVDPRRLPALAPLVARTTPALPPVLVPRRAGGRGARTCLTSWWSTATRCSWSAPAAARPTAGTPGR